ncbi:LOW QUALITY PROTEIN: small ribosomal subunit protein eS6-like [Passerculus sandwichensis]
MRNKWPWSHSDSLGEEWEGYVIWMSGGDDKSFSMKQGVLPHRCVCLLLSKEHSCYQPRGTGERKHKSICSCIVDAKLSVLNSVIVKKSEKGMLGMTDTTLSKRTSRVPKLSNLSKKNDVCQYVVRKPLSKGGKKPRTKAPTILTQVLQDKCRHVALKKQGTQKNKEEAEYKALGKRMNKANEKRQEQIVNWSWLSLLGSSTSKSRQK